MWSAQAYVVFQLDKVLIKQRNGLKNTLHIVNKKFGYGGGWGGIHPVFLGITKLQIP